MPDLPRRAARLTANETEDAEYQQWVGGRIRELRKAMKMNQDDFSYLVGVQRSYMGLIENGKRDLRMNTLRRIALACGIQPHELLNPGFELLTVNLIAEHKN